MQVATKIVFVVHPCRALATAPGETVAGCVTADHDSTGSWGAFIPDHFACKVTVSGGGHTTSQGSCLVLRSWLY
jgi:hypothetical protein